MSDLSRHSQSAQVKPAAIREANLATNATNDNALMGALMDNMLDVANGEPDVETSKPGSYKGNIESKKSIDSSK